MLAWHAPRWAAHGWPHLQVRHAGQVRQRHFGNSSSSCSKGLDYLCASLASGACGESALGAHWQELRKQWATQRGFRRLVQQQVKWLCRAERRWCGSPAPMTLPFCVALPGPGRTPRGHFGFADYTTGGLVAQHSAQHGGVRGAVRGWEQRVARAAAPRGVRHAPAGCACERSASSSGKTRAAN